jgi:hypothetical protein
MRASVIGFSTASAVIALAGLAGQASSVHAAGANDMSVRAPDLEWPLPASERAYGSIDGKKMWQYVVQQAEIARRYRDQGHQFWGRVIGTSSDAEDARWLADKYTQLGLSDVRIQSLDLQPQWLPQSWQVMITSGANNTPLSSAQPAYRSPGTQGPGLDLPAVYVGEGTPADFLGRDVKGKAVFVTSVYPPAFCPQCATPDNVGGPLRLAASKGAAALFYIYTGLPGNVKYQAYPTGTDVPTFVLGTDDGHAIEEAIAKAPAEAPPHVTIRMDVQLVPNLKTALVWGTIPGQTDETIYVIGHRDGWFDASGDNGSGIASMLGLAEYYAKLPKSQRRRTIVFVGLDGHHNSGPGGAVGNAWLLAHRNELFTKTVFMINAEHVSDVATYQFQGKLGLTNVPIPSSWYAGGPSRPRLAKIVADAFQKLGVAAWKDPSDKPPAGDIGRFAAFLPGLEYQSNDFTFFHTDANTPETIPWTGLEAITRADAKIIDAVNKLEMKDLQPTAEISANSTASR